MMPRIWAIAAVTLDGKIARHASHATDWTSPEDKAFMRSLLDASDVIVVGRNTFDAAKEPLSKRNCIVLTRSVSGATRQNDRLIYANADDVALSELLKPYRAVAVLGGTQIYTLFLRHGLLDDLYLTIEPIAFGDGLPLFAHADIEPIAFDLVACKPLNNRGSILLHYRRAEGRRQPSPLTRQ
ncbi:dihydrofolate reductase [Candidatus Parcubacteria bacterium]|nr:MAG: dihydrofolate reductase [Candidatus Parcubacteria bacterium]